MSKKADKKELKLRVSLAVRENGEYVRTDWLYADRIAVAGGKLYIRARLDDVGSRKEQYARWVADTLNLFGCEAVLISKSQMQAQIEDGDFDCKVIDIKDIHNPHPSLKFVGIV